MDIPKSKTFDDLPKLSVISVRHIDPSDAEYQLFEVRCRFPESLEHCFDRMTEGDVCQWFWLFDGSRGCLTPTLESFDKEAKTAVLSCLEKEEPKIDGLAFTYLSPYWQAYHIWMVLDRDWGWERRTFQGTDAVAEDYEAQTASFVDGREVKVWTKLEPVGISSGGSRHYPAADQALPVRSDTRLVPGGWGHEHCELCSQHVDPGMSAYCDLDGRWLCERCYQKYVEARSLSFVDEL